MCKKLVYFICLPHFQHYICNWLHYVLLHWRCPLMMTLVEDTLLLCMSTLFV
jgi:hypothetical protein